jgi:hypothetical protein
MSARQQANQHAFYNIVLTHNDFGYFPPDGIKPVYGRLKSGLGSHFLHCRAPSPNTRGVLTPLSPDEWE